MMQRLLPYLLPLLLLAACGRQTELIATKGEGMLYEQGHTVYQYGTHILTDENGHTSFALSSKEVDLGAYIGKKVKIKGKLYRDYPIDGGPPFMEVLYIKEL
ncbi:MAG: hypothetical protein AB1458_16150 [Bacteroidota bacterium]